MMLDRIGHRLVSQDEAFRWHNLSTAEGTELHYDEAAGMEYEYADELGILAVSHDGVGLVTFYRATGADFDAIVERCGV